MGGNNLNKRGFDQINEVNEPWDGGVIGSKMNNNNILNGDSPILISQSSVSISNERISMETISSNTSINNNNNNNSLNGASSNGLSNNTTPTTTTISNSSLINNNNNSNNDFMNNNNNNYNHNSNNNKDIDIINTSSSNLISNSLINNLTSSTNNSINNSMTNIMNSINTPTKKAKGERKRTKFPDEEVKVLCELVVLFGKDVRTILTFKPFSDGKYSERQIYDKVRALKKAGLVPSHPDLETIRKAKNELGIAENIDTETLRSGKKGRLSNVVTTQHSDSEYSSSEHEDDEPQQNGTLSANSSTTNLIGNNNNNNNLSSTNLNNISSNNILSASQSPQSPNSTNTSTTNLTLQNNKDSSSTSSLSSPTTPSRRTTSMRMSHRRALQENAKSLLESNTSGNNINTPHSLKHQIQQIFDDRINNLSNSNNINNSSSSNLNIISPSTTTSSTILTNRLRERDKEKSSNALERARIDKISDQQQKRIQTREKPAKIYKKETYIDSDTEFEEDEEEDEPPIIGKENSFLQFDYYSSNHNYSLKNNKTFPHNNNNNNNNSNNLTNISSTTTSTTSTSSTSTTTQPISLSSKSFFSERFNPFSNSNNRNNGNNNCSISSGNLITDNLNISSSSLNKYASSILNGTTLVHPNPNSFFRYETENNLLIFYPFFTKNPVNSFIFDKELLILTIEMPNVFDWLLNADKSPISSDTKITIEFPHPGKNYGPPRKINKLPDGINGIAFIFEKIKQGNVDLDISSL